VSSGVAVDDEDVFASEDVTVADNAAGLLSTIGGLMVSFIPPSRRSSTLSTKMEAE
jgi:hypothetical protein